MRCHATRNEILSCREGGKPNRVVGDRVTVYCSTYHMYAHPMHTPEFDSCNIPHPLIRTGKEYVSMMKSKPAVRNIEVASYAACKHE